MMTSSRHEGLFIRPQHALSADFKLSVEPLLFTVVWIEDVKRAASTPIGATREVSAPWIASKKKSH
jgi:hypothetical protein